MVDLPIESTRRVAIGGDIASLVCPSALGSDAVVRYTHGEKHGTAGDRPPLIPTGISAALVFLLSSSLAAGPSSGRVNIEEGRGTKGSERTRPAARRRAIRRTPECDLETMGLLIHHMGMERACTAGYVGQHKTERVPPCVVVEYDGRARLLRGMRDLE